MKKAKTLEVEAVGWKRGRRWSRRTRRRRRAGPQRRERAVKRRRRRSGRRKDPAAGRGQRRRRRRRGAVVAVRAVRQRRTGQLGVRAVRRVAAAGRQPQRRHGAAGRVTRHAAGIQNGRRRRRGHRRREVARRVEVLHAATSRRRVRSAVVHGPVTIRLFRPEIRENSRNARHQTNQQTNVRHHVTLRSQSKSSVVKFQANNIQLFWKLKNNCNFVPNQSNNRKMTYHVSIKIQTEFSAITIQAEECSHSTE